ncbi:MAG TPA: Fic family protein [Lichenihabitans sp.]|jgi:cell filamentation protein|nr:Fic family protein [Lichenihabitans sp.]
MYESGSDPYSYPDSTVLRNRLDIRDQAQLDAYETLITAQRAQEPIPTGRFGYAHYRAIHRHLFQDVFAWAGKPRTVRISKGGNMFCYPEHIDAAMRRLFERLQADNCLRHRSTRDFAKGAAHLLAELNAIHCFREGNGRAQLTFFALLATRAGHPAALDRMQPDAMLQAMTDSFTGNEEPLASLIGRMIGIQ